jgi:hypothetical protein
MGDGQPGAPVDPTKPLQGPYGTGMSGPSFGFCPVDRDWPKEASGNPQTGRDWVLAPPKAPRALDDTDNVMTHLANKKINAFSGVGHGFYFWNFRTDLDEPQWSYMLALERGWIPTGNLNDDRVMEACKNEDSGAFKCVLKKNLPDEPVLAAIHWINDQTNITEDRKVEALTGNDLRDGAEVLIDSYFQTHKGMGVTCDFGGVGLLVEENRTITDDDFLGGSWDDDEYYVYVYTGPPWWLLTIYMVLGTLVGSAVGFMLAMRFSQKFNKRVRQSTFFKNSSFANNPLVRKSLSLPKIDGDLADLEHLFKDDENARLARDNAVKNSRRSYT